MTPRNRIVNCVDSFPYHEISRFAECDNPSDVMVVTVYLAHKAMSHTYCGGWKMIFGNKDK